MLPWLIDWLNCGAAQASGGTPWGKVTGRAVLAAGLAFLLAIVLGRRLIAWLQARFREPIKSASPVVAQLHAAKAWTPTMGGLFIVAGIVAATVLFARPNALVVIAIPFGIALAILGAVDDLAKLRSHRRGLSARQKLIAQVVIATLAACAVYHVHRQTPGALDLRWPGVATIGMGPWFVPLAVLVIVGSSNAVNLTDGLDGLSGGCLLFATSAMAALTYAAGHSEWARYLQVAHVPGAGELVILAAGMLGAVLGFLWFNCFPASVFMGDTGSLPLGGWLGFLAIACRQELIFVVVAGVFVVEAGSVVLQVGWCRWRGRRLFLCAPLHHHFQFRGWPESKIVVRFWIAAALAGLGGLGLVKLAAQQVPPEARPAIAVTRLAARTADLP